jgi:hypothetical protein
MRIPPENLWVWQLAVVYLILGLTLLLLDAFA